MSKDKRLPKGMVEVSLIAQGRENLVIVPGASIRGLVVAFQEPGDYIFGRLNDNYRSDIPEQEQDNRPIVGVPVSTS